MISLSRFGKVIKVGETVVPIVAFKCPMGRHYDEFLVPRKRLHPSYLVEHYQGEGLKLKRKLILGKVG